MFAVFKREFKAFFNNIVGWIFISSILFFYGLYYYLYNLRSGYAYIAYSLAAIEFLMLILVPILSMRVLSEERHMKTDQMFLTYPVSLWKVVTGKFMAMGAVFSLAVAVICITPLVLALYGTVPMGESYTAILGFWLYGLACLAIGEFVSAFTESQIISAVLSFIILFLGYMMSNLCTLISESGNILTTVLKCYDLYTHVGPFFAGTLDLTNVLYFISVIFVALFLTTQLIQKRRYTVSAQGIKLGAFSIGLIVVVLAATWGINFGASKIPSTYTSFDTTYSKIFSISKSTKEYIDKLDQDITIKVWASEDSADTTLAETLRKFADLSKHIKVVYINPTESPEYYKTYSDTEPASNSLFVESATRSKVVSHDDLYVYSYDYTTYSQNIDGYDAEGQIVSAIEYVTMASENLPVIYQLEGHNEQELPTKFAQAITKSNMSLEKLSLLTTDAVPDDAQMVIVNGAMSDLSSDDADKLRAYLDNGGTVLVTTSYDGGEQPNLESIFSDYGITKQPGVVMENDYTRMYANTVYFLLPEVISNTYTKDVDNGYVFAPYASGLTIESDNEAYSYMELLATSDSAVSKTDLTKEIKTTEYEDGDVAGPFYIGVSAMKADEPGTLVVISSIDVFTEDADSVVAGSNLGLFTGIVAKHVSESELDLPVIESKSYTVANLVMNSAIGILVGLLIMIILPIVMTVSGIVIWALRRKK